jgi:hypothetical protein
VHTHVPTVAHGRSQAGTGRDWPGASMRGAAGR